jgi:glucose-1-phosphate thymidylyltransferase
MLEANRLVLEDIESRNEGELIDSDVEGRVVIEPGARLERSRVRGPAVIGAGAVITDSYIGPYTAIDSGVQIRGSEIEHSIVLSGSQILDIGTRIEASLLGRDVTLRRGERMPKTLQFLVGDNADISIP